MRGNSLICPRCRQEAGRGLRRCPNDGAFYVAQRALNKAPRDALLGAFVAERYAVIEIIGAGGMGAVYKAIDENTGTPVAIKFLREEYAHHSGLRTRFVREAEAGAAIQSPHVVSLLDFGVDVDQTLYIVMAYVDGHTLRDEVNRNGPLSVSCGVEIAKQLLQGLHAAHRVGVIHRDLKHDNVMWFGRRDRFVARILDFGVVKFTDLQDREEEQGRLTQVGALVGSPSYMSPEQVRGLEVGPPADLYSLAVVLFEAMTARPLFPTTSYEALLKEDARREVPTMRHTGGGEPVPADLDRILRRALAYDPAERYPDAKTMLMAIEQIELEPTSGLPSDLLADGPSHGDETYATDPPAAIAAVPTGPASTFQPFQRVASDPLAMALLFDEPAPAGHEVQATPAETPRERAGLAYTEDTIVSPPPNRPIPPQETAVMSSLVGNPLVSPPVAIVAGLAVGWVIAHFLIGL